MVTRIVAAALLLGSCAAPGGEGAGVTGVASEPRFFVEALSFRAHNETGVDATGSDEVVGVFDAAQYRLITDRYGDIDAGETQAFLSGQNCIVPATDAGGRDFKWTCIERGTQAPLTFTVALYEHDAQILNFCVQGNRSDLLPPSTGLCFDASSKAQLIGRTKLEFSRQQLVELMPRTGDTHTGRVSLFGGCDGAQSPCVAGGTSGPSPDYTLTYRITRVGGRVVEPPVDPTPR